MLTAITRSLIAIMRTHRWRGRADRLGLCIGWGARHAAALRAEEAEDDVVVPLQ